MTMTTQHEGFRGDVRRGYDAATGTRPGLARRALVANLGGVAGLLLLPLVWIGLPLTGWLLGMAGWLVNSLGHTATMRMVGSMPQTLAVGTAGLLMMVRIWIVAGAFALVGLDARIGELQVGWGQPDTAIAAMLVFVFAFTVEMGARLLGELRRRAAQESSKESAA